MYLNTPEHINSNKIPGRLPQLAWKLFLPYIIFVLASCSGTQELNEWPCFHGVDRTNKSTETGLAREWPDEGPKLLWTASGLGEGYSSISVGEGLLYVAGIVDDQAHVFAFDMAGKPVWKKPNGQSWSTNMSHARTYTGSRSTPTYDKGVLYHLGEGGRLAAFEATTGIEIWSVDIISVFDAVMPEYGYSESVMIDGDNLYVRPAGKKGFFVCLDKHSGDLKWANTDIDGLEGYSSPVIIEHGGYRQLISSSSNSYFGLDTDSGRLLWKIDFENERELNITDPIVFQDYVFISSGYGKGSLLMKLTSSVNTIVPEVVWQSELMDNHHGGVILHEEYLYGSGSNSRGWFCIEFLTGEEVWKAEGGKGSLTFADGMLYFLDERGKISLVKATPDSYISSGEFQVPEGGSGMYWAHPAVCGGRLYLRHSDKLYAYDISEENL